MTHITGIVVNVEGRVIQRCALCGAKLVDSLGCAMAVMPGEPPPVFPTWEVNRLVRVTTGNPIRYELLPAELTKLPPDHCEEFA